MQPHLATEIEIAVLVEILIPKQPPLYVQNFCPEPYLYCNRLYEFCAFSAPGVAKQLSMDNSGQQLTIENSSAFDALKPIRDLLYQGDGWRKGLIRMHQVFPEYPDHQPITMRSMVLSSKIQGPAISINTQSPIGATNAAVPSSFITNQTVPELIRAN